MIHGFGQADGAADVQQQGQGTEDAALDALCCHGVGASSGSVQDPLITASDFCRVGVLLLEDAD